MDNKIVSLAMVLVVGIILAGSVLAPTLNNASAETLTVENIGSSYMAPDGETHTIQIEIDPALRITTDGEPCIIPDFGTMTIVYGNNGIVRLTTTSGAVAISIETLNTVSNFAAPCTITIQGTTTTINNKSFDSTTAFIASSGEYVLTSDAYVLESSNIIGGGNTYKIQPGGTGNTANVWGIFNGIPENGIEFNKTTIIPATAETSIEPGIVTKEKVTGNLYRIKDITWNSSTTFEDSSTMEFPLVYTYFLAPKTVEYENPAYVGSSAAGVMVAIPALVIVSLLMLAVNAIRTKDD